MTLAEQWKQEGYQKGIEKGKLEGKLEGKKEEKMEIARSLLAEGIDIGIISSATGLSSQEIKKLLS